MSTVSALVPEVIASEASMAPLSDPTMLEMDVTIYLMGLRCEV